MDVLPRVYKNTSLPYTCKNFIANSNIFSLLEYILLHKTKSLSAKNRVFPKVFIKLYSILFLNP